MYIKAWEVMGYSFEADLHCIWCTAERFGDAALDNDFEAEDREGNPVHPIFASDEDSMDFCGDCHRRLIES